MPRETRPITTLADARPCRLADLAHLLPPQSWAAQRLADNPEAGDEAALLIEGDAELAAIELDRLPGSDADEETARPWLLLVTGSLRVAGAICNENTDGAAGLIVLGDLHARNMALGGQEVFVVGNFTVDELCWGDYNHGTLRVLGSTMAQVLLVTDEYHIELAGPTQIDLVIDGDPLADRPLDLDRDSLARVLKPSCLVDDMGGGGEGSEVVDREALLQLLRAGGRVLRSDADLAVLAAEGDDLFPDSEISVENVQRIVGAGLIDPGQNDVSTWTRAAWFMVRRRHIDEDGDQIDDQVFIEAHRKGVLHKFYLGAKEIPGKRRISRLFRRDAPTHNLSLLHKRDEGEWLDLSAETDAEAWRIARHAWRGILDHVRQGVAETHADYPAWRAAMAAITVPRVAALIKLPLLAEKYNDWDSGDRSGYWQDDLWVGARQVYTGDGKTFPPLLKILWHTGDDEDDNDGHSAYFIELDDPDPAKSGVRFAHFVRQSDSRQPVPRHAAEHLIRLVRYFDIVEKQLLVDNTAYVAEQLAIRERGEAARLLGQPPYPADLPDEAIFSAPVLALTERWQTEGRARVDTVHAYQRACDAGEQPDGLDDDPRTDIAATILAVARNVQGCQDEALTERFCRRFPFSPEPFGEFANKHGGFIGPVFMIDECRIVARLGAPWDEDAGFVMVEGLSMQHLENVEGLGRSMNREVWASADSDTIVTRQGYDGPVIARFPFPDGTEGLPAGFAATPDPLARRCDELIPFNDGRRLLLRNPTGVYLLDYRGAMRLHPHDFDDEGPYTWPKNRGDGSLDMDMLHMALSPDERWIAVGDQDSEHRLLTAAGEAVQDIGPRSSYPHFATFSADSRSVLFNSCHFYNGVTLAVPVATPDAEPVEVQDNLRVYAGLGLAGERGEEVLMGSTGYLYGMASAGGTLWEHHIGGTVSAIDCTPDGRHILVATYGGYLALLDQNPDGPGPYAIGNSPYRERWRWIFWEYPDIEDRGPLRW